MGFRNFHFSLVGREIADRNYFTHARLHNTAARHTMSGRV